MADPPAPHRGLPEEICIWEILLRLPPKSLLRCRAWRGATSTRDFLLAHHARQPTLPILHILGNNNVNGLFLEVNLFDNRAGVAAADRLQSVARLGAGHAYFALESCCDGLLAVSIDVDSLCICNPATRQYAPLPLLCQFDVMGMYPHTPTGDYRLLLAPKDKAQDGVYIYTLGSSQPPRRIDTVLPCGPIYVASGIVMFHGSIHWCVENMIIVFDTTAESFRQMRAPVDPDGADLFEMDGTLSMSIFNDATTSIDIWMTRDYESEIWALKYRVELPVAELTNQFGKFYKLWWLVVMSDEGDVLVLVKFGDSVLQIDVNGKLVASIHCGRLCPTRLWFKQTLVSHTFFPALEGYVVNTSPFI